MQESLATAQMLKYADELRHLHASERTQRRAAEDALELLEGSYRTTVRALAAALELRDDQTGGHAGRVAARIFSVVDAFDAMTNDRPYRQALPVEVALELVAGASGTQFEPAVANAFVGLFAELAA